MGFSGQLPPCLILFTGGPGVGKLTIAKIIKARLDAINQVNRLIDNHLLIDPITAIEPERTPNHYWMRETFRKTCFTGLKRCVVDDAVILMTAALYTEDDSVEQFYEYLGIARVLQVPFVFVALSCSEEDNARRLTSDDRKSGGKTKLTDLAIMKANLAKYILLDPEVLPDHPRYKRVLDAHLNTLKLNTSGLSPDETAERVCEFASRAVMRPEFYIQ